MEITPQTAEPIPPTAPQQPSVEAPTSPETTVIPAYDLETPIQITEAPNETIDSTVNAEPAAKYETPAEARPELVSDLPPLQPEHAEQQAATEPAAISEPFPVAPTMAYEPEPITPDPNAAMPNADQMELSDAEAANLEIPPEDPLTIQKVGTTVGVVLAVVMVGLLIKSNSAVLGGHKLKEKGYTYNFKFYKNTNTLKYGDGTTALVHKTDKTVGSLKPTLTAKTETCTMLGNGWRKVFDATINAKAVAVCTPDNKTYIAEFPAAGHDQLFTISYANVQKPDIYPLLKTMFASVSVKK